MWQLVRDSDTLEALAAVGDSGATETTPDDSVSGDERLIWRLEDGDLEIYPRLQKRGKRGAWSKGRAVALERLYSGSVDCIDRRRFLRSGTMHCYRGRNWFGSLL